MTTHDTVQCPNSGCVAVIGLWLLLLTLMVAQLAVAVVRIVDATPGVELPEVVWWLGVDTTK